MYTLNDMISLGTRLEWFRDADGGRVLALRSGAGGVPANYYAASFGANISATDYLMLRPEVRADFQDLLKGAETKSFNNGKDDYQVLIGMNAVLKF